MVSTRQMVMTLINEEQDFEWYPTSQPMIDVIRNDINKEYAHENPSVLDCGAGDGRVLNALTDGDKYAIEKSTPLLDALDKDIFVVGTEFLSQSLIDKRVDIVISNPPYSVFELWMKKIIKEANCGDIYLVVPNRWKDNEEILEIIEQRDAEVITLGSFDFLDAERAARAQVEILKIKMSYHGRWSNSTPKKDPFTVWFDEYFQIDVNESSTSDYESISQSKSKLNDSVHQELVKGGDLVSTLETFYQRDMEKLIGIYQSLSTIDSQILKELDVNLEGVRKALQQKISGLKSLYWNELFDNFSKITDRLTTESRNTLLKTLTRNTHIDFTSANVHAVVIWVIKNCNNFLEDQLCTLVKRMTEKANVRLYKSNQRTWKDEDWRYCRKPTDLERYMLDYRMVLEHTGGLHMGYGNGINGLSERAAEFINDICAVAYNLGFDTYQLPRAADFRWESNGKNVFEFRDTNSGKVKTLFDVKAFKNGNLHLRLNPKFISRLNVEYGRLMGWVKSPREASEEMDIPFEEAAEGFQSNLKLEKNNFLQLGHAA